jgi:O-antigen/teichoic acid export membrane protein
LGNVRRSLTVNTIGVVAVAAAGFAAMLVLARRLPVEAFGTVSVSLMIANAVAVFDGVRPVVVYEATRTEVSLAALHRTVWRLFLWIGAMATLVTLAIAGALWFEQIGLAGLAMLGLVVFLYFPAACNWGFLDARNDTAFTGLARSIAWVAVYAAYMATAFVSADPVFYLLPLVAMNAGLALGYRRRLGAIAADAGGGRSPTPREILRRSLDNLGVNIAATTIGTIDRVVLSAMSGMHGVGLYAAQYELATKPQALLRVANAVLFPAAAKLHASGRNLVEPWLRTTLAGSQALAALVAVLVGAREPIVAMLLGPTYASHADVFGLLVIAFVVQFFGYACPVLLNALGDFSSQRRLYLWAAAAMVIAVAPVTHAFGITGLAGLYLAVRGVDLLLFVRTLSSTRSRPRWALVGLHLLVAGTALGLAWSASVAATLAGAIASALAAWALLRMPASRLARP